MFMDCGIICTHFHAFMSYTYNSLFFFRGRNQKNGYGFRVSCTANIMFF